uniref:Uncharacterized protein n=1 Tax=Tanacetum cinerariifolium TaxID=118510 RepID=A0A6L2NUD3_TANCI|nr:hypothetical protein [Tanacetum cinerariifolium]
MMGRLRCKGVTKQTAGVIPKGLALQEYIRLEEEKARRHGKVYKWETAKYGKIWYDEDVQDTRSIETEFPDIVFNDNLTSNKTPSCEPTLSSLNDEIDFRVSFDNSDDEDYNDKDNDDDNVDIEHSSRDLFVKPLPDVINTDYYCVCSRSPLLDPLKGGWIDSLEELPTLGTSLKKLLSKAIQTMTDHSQKWHEGTSGRNISSSSDTDGLAAVISKLDHLGRDMKKLKENVHEIQFGCQICEGTHLNKECHLNEEVKQVDEVKYSEFGHQAPFNENSGAKFHVGPPGYCMRFSNDEESETTKVKTSKAIPKWKSNLPKEPVNHYVKPYVQPIHFPNRLKQHAEEALVYKTMESLKKIMVNRPFLKEIRQTDNYPRYMKDLVANKPRMMMKLG